MEPDPLTAIRWYGCFPFGLIAVTLAFPDLQDGPLEALALA